MAKIMDLDFVFISYNEPNKEENYADLVNKVPWAKRVDGVEGFDSAHKAAAEVADTDFFISVDGDNIIDESFLLETLDFEKTDQKAVHRWRARNSVNGLVYGNGGLVGWDKQTCMNMKTHENALASDAEGQIDFCWSVPHVNLHNCYSTTVINGTPEQAFVAGYREGVKMSLVKGKKIDPNRFKNDIPKENLKRLITWMSVGKDVDNGKYAMLGARMGCYLTTIKEADILSVRNLKHLFTMFTHNSTKMDIDRDLQAHGESIRQRLGIPVADLTEEQSKFFKFCQPVNKNKGVQDIEN